jgi:hypothetical protein
MRNIDSSFRQPATATMSSGVADSYANYEPRSGLFRWWFRLTGPSSPDPRRPINPAERARLRRAGLTSAIAPFVALGPLFLLGQASVDTITMISILGIWALLVLVLILNRAGLQVTAAFLLVAGITGIIEAALLVAGLGTAPGSGLGSGWLLTFALFIIPLRVFRNLRSGVR